MAKPIWCCTLVSIKCPWNYINFWWFPLPTNFVTADILTPGILLFGLLDRFTQDAWVKFNHHTYITKYKLGKVVEAVEQLNAGLIKKENVVNVSIIYFSFIFQFCFFSHTYLFFLFLSCNLLSSTTSFWAIFCRPHGYYTCSLVLFWTWWNNSHTFSPLRCAALRYK